MSEIAVVLPVRDGGTGRSERLNSCLSSWKEMSEGRSRLHLIVDEDDIHNYAQIIDEYIPHLHIVPRMNLVPKLNSVCDIIADEHQYMAFIGDDIVFRTPWESKFADYLKTVPAGVVYGNDLVHAEKLGTHPCVSSSIVKELGFFGCPAIQHSYFDNYWMRMGQELGTLKYFPEVIMEHNHHHIGKNKYDSINAMIDSMFNGDRENFTDYMSNSFPNDMERVKGLWQKH